MREYSIIHCVDGLIIIEILWYVFTKSTFKDFLKSHNINSRTFENYVVWKFYDSIQYSFNSIIIFSDIGGYVVGKSIGGRKLTKISPNKTISGTIGSFVFSLIPITIIYSPYLFSNIITTTDITIITLTILLCLFCSLVCQIGDLFISYLKRKAKVKDTGTILPGHGGILDRVDGIIFALPVYSFFVMNWSSGI